MMKSKYSLGDIVYLSKYFSKEKGGSYVYPEKPIYARIKKIEKTVSLGYAYNLESLCGTHLGGVLYWEDHIDGLASTGSEAEEAMWRMWGDQ